MQFNILSLDQKRFLYFHSETFSQPSYEVIENTCIDYMDIIYKEKYMPHLGRAKEMKPIRYEPWLS